MEEKFVKLLASGIKKLMKLYTICEPPVTKAIEFLVMNKLYILWFFVYIFISPLLILPFFKSYGTSFGVSIGFYLLTMFIAYVAGDEILKLIENIRPIETKKELEYLNPIFEELYNEIKETVPQLPKIELHIIDEMTVNACAVGHNTVAVTQGAINTFSEEQLRGVIAHEIGHIYNGNTQAVIWNTVGNGVISVYAFIVRFIFNTLFHMQEPIQGKTYGVIYFILNTFYRLFNFIIKCFLFLGNVILSGNSRDAEYEADKFAFDVGYGEELNQALYTLQKISLSPDASLVERMQSSHPRISKRIAEIENMIDSKEPYFALDP
ncbi:MAG: M48 family metalloprotease [Oscillospiraceae bacterium]|nr:M48 family metalloprotease [Oscillospiraceae bacterium]